MFYNYEIELKDEQTLTNVYWSELFWSLLHVNIFTQEKAASAMAKGRYSLWFKGVLVCVAVHTSQLQMLVIIYN